MHSAHMHPRTLKTHSPSSPPTHPLTHFVFLTLTRYITFLKKLCSMSMLMCWQWFLLHREAVLLNPNSPGTERILSQALTAVMLQHFFFNNFLSHPLLILFASLFPSLPLLSHFLISIPSPLLYPI